jgi:glyoxylase-like metal-dependent hydrolase (beta-lactamase superfamily II)
MNKRQLQQFSPRVHWLPPDEDTDRPILGLISGQNGSLVVEAGNSIAHAHLLLDQITHLPPVRYLCLTHWHWDHVFGTAAFTVPIFAHHETKRMVEQMAAWDWRDAALDQRVADGIEIEFARDMIKRELPDRRHLVIRPPDISFDSQVEIDLGGLTCQLIHVGGDHASDATIVHVPEEKVVFLSDCLYPAIYAEPRYYTEKILTLYNRVLALDAAHYFWGHDPNIMTRTEMQQEAEQLSVVSAIVREVPGTPQTLLTNLQQTHPHLVNDYTLDLIATFQNGLEEGDD